MALARTRLKSPQTAAAGAMRLNSFDSLPSFPKAFARMPLSPKPTRMPPTRSMVPVTQRREVEVARTDSSGDLSLRESLLEATIQNRRKKVLVQAYTNMYLSCNRKTDIKAHKSARVYVHDGQ